MKLSLCRYLSLGVACLLLVGCGGGGVTPSGKLTKGGAPLKVSEKGMVQVHLLPAEGQVQTVYTAQVAADGSFTVKGADGKPIPAGKYKIGVVAMDPYPTHDLLKGKFDDKKTTIVRDVKAGQPLDIDLDKP